MIHEEEDPTPEWEVKDEEIPPSLQKKWNDYVRKGMKAGICRSCGQLFTENDLSCPHCGAPIQKSPGLGWLFIAMLALLAFLAYLFFTR